MRDKIKQLAEQAGLAHFTDVMINGQIETITSFKMGVGISELEKFAKLIKDEK